MRPFIIDEEVKQKLSALALYAEKNPYTMDDMLDIFNKAKSPAGDLDEFIVFVPFGYKVVYSIEKQVKGDVRHLSMSVDADRKLPNPGVVEEVMKMLGFKCDMSECRIWIESISEKREAINIAEII